jgi:hypothetical protein
MTCQHSGLMVRAFQAHFLFSFLVHFLLIILFISCSLSCYAVDKPSGVLCVVLSCHCALHVIRTPGSSSSSSAAVLGCVMCDGPVVCWAMLLWRLLVHADRPDRS